MSKLVAMAIPIIPGKEGEWKEWLNELRTNRHDEFEASRDAMKVHERTFLQHTPMGDMVIVTLEGEDPAAAFAKFAHGDDAFTKWFVAHVQNVHGIDLANMPEAPMPELVMDSENRY